MASEGVCVCCLSAMDSVRQSERKDFTLPAHTEFQILGFWKVLRLENLSKMLFLWTLVCPSLLKVLCVGFKRTCLS